MTVSRLKAQAVKAFNSITLTVCLKWFNTHNCSSDLSKLKILGVSAVNGEALLETIRKFGINTPNLGRSYN